MSHVFRQLALFGAATALGDGGGRNPGADHDQVEHLVHHGFPKRTPLYGGVCSHNLQAVLQFQGL